MAIYRSYFYNNLIKKYIASFGQLFSDIEVVRYDLDTKEVFRERVPLDYAAKEKWHRLKDEDPEFTRYISTKLPRMSWELMGFNYDALRSQPARLQHRARLATSPSGSTKMFYSPIPYDFNFKLNIMTKTHDDLHQIVEQIIPAFKPDVAMDILVIPSMNYTQNCHVNLMGYTQNDTYEGGARELRYVTASFDFVLKGWFIGPVRDTKVILKSVTTVNGPEGQLFADGAAPYADGRDEIEDVLSSDEYEFLRVTGYFPNTNDLINALDDAFEERKLNP